MESIPSTFILILMLMLMLMLMLIVNFLMNLDRKSILPKGKLSID